MSHLSDYYSGSDTYRLEEALEQIKKSYRSKPDTTSYDALYVPSYGRTGFSRGLMYQVGKKFPKAAKYWRSGISGKASWDRIYTFKENNVDVNFIRVCQSQAAFVGQDRLELCYGVIRQHIQEQGYSHPAIPVIYTGRKRIATYANSKVLRDKLFPDTCLKLQSPCPTPVMSLVEIAREGLTYEVI